MQIKCFESASTYKIGKYSCELQLLKPGIHYVIFALIVQSEQVDAS